MKPKEVQFMELIGDFQRNLKSCRCKDHHQIRL